MHKKYLGDGVYIEIDTRNAFILTTEDGVDATNTIVLEPQVIDALLLYIHTAQDGKAVRCPHCKGLSWYTKKEKEGRCGTCGHYHAFQ
jgi:hypothetical protein